MKKSRVMVLVAVLAGSLFLAGSLWGAQSPLWTTTFNFQTNYPQYNTIDIFGVAASNSSIIVCGTAYDMMAPYTAQLGFIKAFDQGTGNPIWTDYLTAATGNINNENQFCSISVAGSTVLVEGYSCSYAQAQGSWQFSFYKSFLRAYNADMGNLLWEAPQIAAALNTGPQNIITANNKVFVVRNQKPFNDSSGTTGNCIVEAYQVGAAIAAPTSLLLQ